MMEILRRIERLNNIAKEEGVKANIRKLGGRIYANINGQSFVVHGYDQFIKMCRELKDYKPPKLIDLTNRLAEIEREAIKNYE